MENTFLSKLLAKTEISTDSDQKQFLYVASKWLENALELHVYASYSNKTFKGQLSADDFVKCASELEKPVTDFYEECKDAITSTSPQTFEYELVEEDLQFRLIKKHKLAINYLEVPLKLISNNSVMLDNAVNLISDLREARNAESNSARKDDKTSQELLLQLDHCLREKENMERKLLRKFLLLLNTKKTKINELNELLRQKGIENSDKEQGDSTSVADQNSNGEDDFDAETQLLSEDDYMEAETSARMRKKRHMRIGSDDSS